MEIETVINVLKYFISFSISIISGTTDHMSTENMSIHFDQISIIYLKPGLRHSAMCISKLPRKPVSVMTGTRIVIATRSYIENRKYIFMVSIHDSIQIFQAGMGLHIRSYR